MGTRIKTFDSTGVAPNGRLFAGDLNAMEDQYADLSNLAQTLGVGTIQVGESGLQIVRYGAGEMRISGHVRTDGILRGLGGLYAGAYTTTQRDAIPLGSRPYGLVILNTTTNRLEINVGTDPTPSWSGLSSSISRGTLGTRPGPAASNSGALYFATDDQGGTVYYSDGVVWTKLAPGLSQAPNVHANTHLAGNSDAIAWGTIHQIGTFAARPAATGITGYLYFATDTNGGTLYRSNGSTWDQVSRGLTQAITTSMIPANAVSFSQLESMLPEPHRALMAAMVEGVLPGWGTTPQTALQLSAGGGYTLNMNNGKALIQGDDSQNQGMYLGEFPTGGSITLTGTAPANPRWDAIVLQVNDNNYGYTARTPLNAFSLVQVQGTPNASAAVGNLLGAPAIPSSAILLAYYLVKSTDAGIVGAQLNDQRKLAGPGIWGEDGHLYRLGIDSSGRLGTEQVA